MKQVSLNAVFFIATILTASVSLASYASSNNSGKVNNAKIVACNKATERFFSNVQLDGNVLWGSVQGQKCRVMIDTFNNYEKMFLNVSGTTNYYASLELHTNAEPNVTGISNNLSQCDVTSRSVTIRNVYRMPRTIYYSPRGIGRSPSIFDARLNQTVRMDKDASGRLVSVKINDGQHSNTCYFK
jgi:hypothetical protein